MGTLPQQSNRFASVFLHHCSYSNTLSLAAPFLASNFPFEWSPRHEVAFTSCVPYVGLQCLSFKLLH